MTTLNNDTVNHQHYLQPHSYLGLVPRLVIPFISSRKGSPLLDIRYVDYALVKLIAVANSGEEPLSLIEFVINGEFQPGAMLYGSYQFLRFPFLLHKGCLLEAILQPPSVANLPFDCSYLKLPVSSTVSTNTSRFVFNAGKAICLEGK